MNSKIAEAIHLNNHPVALLWADAAPQDAIRFKPGRWGCVVGLFATAAVKGRAGAFDRETYGCWGGGVGLDSAIATKVFPAESSASAVFFPTVMRKLRKDARLVSRWLPGATER